MSVEPPNHCLENCTAASKEVRVGVATWNSTQHQQVVLTRDVLTRDEITIGAESCDVTIDADDNIAGLHCRLSIVKTPVETAIELVNLGHRIVLENGVGINRNERHLAALPIHFSISNTRLQIFEIARHEETDSSLARLAPSGGTPPKDRRSIESEEITPAPATLAAWLETVSALQKSVADSHTFFQDAAHAISNPGGFDGGFILLPNRDRKRADLPQQWEIVASHIPFPDSPIRFRSDLIERAVAEGSTLFHDTSKLTAAKQAITSEAAVVSPVLNNRGKVIAVVYGFREQRSGHNRIGVRRFEAQFIQLIANTILSAMTRLEKEAEASRSRVLLEQAFSPKVARHLEVAPNILEGRTTDVTVLFVDLRNFSTISDQAGPKVTYQLLTDVMDRFSEIIARHDGVIIDYFGDGLSAFWNAPIEQPDHVMLACQAAEDLHSSLPELNNRWAQRLNQTLRVGVGIHTGVAQVGNSGSTQRLKYGPSGSTVNIASRLEAATKCIGSPTLVSKAVADQVNEFYRGRRVCRTALAGIRSPMDVYELFARPVSSSIVEQMKKYDQCLTLYETHKFLDAITQLCELNLELPDNATEFLLEQAMAKNRFTIDRRKKNNQKSSVTALTRETTVPSYR